MSEHIHKSAIIAYANGAKLQYKDAFGVWCDFNVSGFSKYLEIRIKPTDEDVNAVREVKNAKIAELKRAIDELERNL